MADLGALNLILGADLSPLEASLGRADELINRSAAQMQKSFGKPFKFKVEVGDLAVQLTQTEGVVDRSIRQVRSLARQPIKFNLETGELNVQLTEAEALISRTLQDIKAMDRSIAFNLSVRGLDDVEGLVARSIQQMSALSNSVLTVQVDDKRLTELNQHLDAKQAHYARVQQQFATPLKVLVDDSQLTSLNQHLTGMEQHLSSVAGKFAATKLTPAIDLTNLNLLDRRLNGSIDNLHRAQSEFERPIVTNVDTRQLLELEGLLDRVERPHKLRLDLPDTIGGLTSAIGKLVLSPVTIPLKIAQNSLEGIFRGMSEGLGRELSRNFSKGFSSSIEGFVQKRTGMSTKEMGEQSGKYVATRGKIGAEYISQELGYKDGLRGVGNDLKAAGTSVDTVLRNPRRAVRKIENKLVEALEYYQEGETDKAMNVVTESFAPMGKLARRAAGVGIRAAAQPIRIRNRAMLKGKEAEAQQLAKNIEIEGYDREAADKAEAIHIVTGGLDFNNGENAHFAGGLLKQQYPKAHTITHVNKAMNQPVKRGEGVVGGVMGMMEQLQKMGGKEGKIGDMPIQKLAEMAIDLGYNPDGLEMYAKAVKIRQAHPDKPINFMGTSGGVDAVNYATALAERAGMKNVKGVGLGLPMTNLTELASKRNFQSVVGTLDDLDIGYHNTDFLGAKRKADSASMAEIKKIKDEKFPFDMSGMFSVGKTQRHILDGGKGHAIGNSYLGNDNVMGAVNDFIARPGSPTPAIRSDIKDAASLNNFYADKFNAKRKEIPLTIAALYKDPKALARIEADPNGKSGDYTYFSPANKNHEDDWLRLNEFDGLIKDVRGQDIQGRSEQANSESKKKGLDKFIKARREKAAKKGTTSVVAEHAAGWLDYLDLMKGGMEEYGKTGAMPYDALQKGAEYYPELRPLAAREQHKQNMVLSKDLTPSGVEVQKSSLDKLYASGDIDKINQRRATDKLTSINNNYGYKDALATPDSYIKDLDKQRANTAAEIAKNQAEMAKLKSNSVKVANPIADEAQYNPFEDSAKQLKDKANRRKLQRSSSETKEDTFLNVGANPQISKPATTDLPKEQPKDKFTAAVDKFDRAVDKFSTNGNTGQKVDIRPKVNTPAPPEYVEVGALQTLAADTARAGGRMAVNGIGATAKWAAKPVSNAIQSTASDIGKGYRAVERAEDLAFQIFPGARLTKSVITNVAAPMGIAAMAAQNPVVGGAINAGMGIVGGVVGGIGHQLASTLPFGLSNMAHGAANLAETYGPALFGGKFVLNAGKELAKKAFPGFSRTPEMAEAENRKQLDRSEIEEMKAAIQAELQALKNFQTLTQPDAPKITPAQDRAAQKTIADHTKEQEGKLNQKFDRLANNNPPKLEQPITTNVKSIDVGDANAIGSEVQRLGAVIRSNRKSIVNMLKSGNPEEIAKGLQQAEAFGYGLNVVRGDLEATRAKIAPAKITNPGDVKNLESSRKSIDGFLGSPGAQTASIQEAVSKVSENNNLVQQVNPYLPAQARNSIFDRIKSALKPKPSNNNNDAGFSQIEAVLGSLIAATAIPLVGAPIAAPIAIGGGLIAALKKSAFAKSKLGQTRIPGLDFLDNPIKSFSETIGLTSREPDPTPASDKDTVLENARSRMLGRAKWQFLLAGTKYATRSKDSETSEPDPTPAKPPVPKLPKNPKLEINDPWQENGSFSTPIPPKQALPSPYPQQPDPWTKRPAPPIPPSPKSLVYTPTFTPNLNAPPPPRNPQLFTPPAAEVEKSENALDKLKNTAGKVVGALTGFAALTFIVPMLGQFARGAFEASANMQRLELSVGAVTRSKTQADSVIARSVAQSNYLGYDKNAGIESTTQFRATTKDTGLELVSDDIQQSLAQYNRVLGVDQNRAKLAQVAVQQIASKGKLQAEELFGQLAEASPGAVNVLARSQGMSVSQLRKLAENGGIDVSDALPRFGQQLKAESQGSADSASKSADAALGRLQNAGTGINEAFGNQFMMPAVLGMELASGAAAIFANNLGLITQVITAGLTAKIIGLGIEVYKSGVLANLARGGFDGFKETLSQMKGPLLQFVGTMAAAYLAMEVFKGIMFSLDGGPFDKLADDAEAAFDRIGNASAKTAKELKEAETRKQKAKDEFYGKDRNIFQKGTDAVTQRARSIAPERGSLADWASTLIPGSSLIKGLARGTNNVEQKVNEGIVNQDRTISANSNILKSNDRDRIGLTSEQVNRRAGIEDELRRLKVEQLSYTSRDRDKLATNLTRTQSLIGERSKLEQPINDRQGELETLKKSTKELIDNPFTQPSVKIQAKLDLSEAERQLRELQAELSIVSDKAPNKKLLDEIVAKFGGISADAAVGQQRQSIERNRLETSGQLTKGGAEYTASIDRQSALTAQITATSKNIQDLKSALTANDSNAISTVQKLHQVDDTTSSTELNQKAGLAPSATDKEILTKLAVAKDEGDKLNGLQSQVSDARTEMYRRIEQENRDAMLYYLGLAKQIDPQGMAFTKAIAQVTQEKNKLLSKLNGYGNGMFDSFIGSVLELFDSSKRKLDAMAQYATARKSALDDYRDRSNQADTTARNAFNAPGQQSAAPSNYAGAQSESPAPVESNSSVPAAQPIPQPRTVRTTSPSKQTRSHQNVKPQIDAAVSQLTPQQRHNYLNTTMSVDGKTDLGLDDYDRRVLGMGGGIPGVKVKKIGISPYSPKNSSSDRAVVNAINNGTYTPTTQSTIPQPTASSQGAAKLGKVKPTNLGNWNGKSDVASQQILNQTIDKAETGLATAFSDDAYQSLISQQKARRETKVAEQQNRSAIRKQQQSLRGLKPTRTIQEKQGNEIADFDGNAIDTKESASNYRTNLSDTVGNIQEIIPVLQSRQGAKGLSAKEKTLPIAQQKSLIEERKNKLIEAQKLLKSLSSTLKTVDTNFGQIDDKVKAARERIIEQQGYDRDVAVEQTGIQVSEGRRTQIDAQRTGIQQKLKSQPFNREANQKDRELEESSSTISIENERKRAQRAITDTERRGDYNIDRTPEQAKAFVAKLRIEVDLTAKQKLKVGVDDRIQKGKDFDFNVDTENQAFDEGALRQEATGFDIGSRRQTALDRTDAPFANNNSIDRTYTRKIKELDLELEVAKETLRKKNERFKGTDPTSTGLRARAGQEFTEAERQIELKRSTATVENNADTADRERSRRGVLYAQQVSTFDSQFAVASAQTQQRKLMGQDTREQDYQAQKLTKQKEFSQKEFDLTQQRSQITALTPEADAARAQIDGLLTNLKALESIELSNLSAQFNQLNQIVGETQKATSDTFKDLLKDTSTSLFDDFFGGKTQKEKALSDKNLKKYLGNILSSPFLAFGNQMVDKLVPDLFSGLYQKSPQGAGSQPQQGGGDILGGLLNGLLGGLLGGKGFATGGIKGGIAPINNGIIGSGRSQVDNRLALVEDGEAIISHRGIDALGGPSVIDKINKGDIPRFASGGIKNPSYSTPKPNTSVPNLTNNATNLSNVSANVTINNSDGKSSVSTQEDGSKLGKLINNAISAALIKEMRAGGLLYA